MYIYIYIYNINFASLFPMVQSAGGWPRLFISNSIREVQILLDFFLDGIWLNSNHLCALLASISTVVSDYCDLRLTYDLITTEMVGFASAFFLFFLFSFFAPFFLLFSRCSLFSILKLYSLFCILNLLIKFVWTLSW